MGFAIWTPLVVISVIAAITDWRTGEIPNWLNLPVVAGAPLVFLAIDGWQGAVRSIVGALGCGLVPYVLFRRDALGGGDVKLLAALGAVAGLQVGIAIQLFAFAVASAHGLALLAHRGLLARMLRGVGLAFANLFVRRENRRVIDPLPAIPLRLGSSILFGTLIALLENQVRLG
jgi:prepilin peptidase CpaA